MMLTLNSTLIAILKEDILPILEERDVGALTISLKSILQHFNFQPTLEKIGTHGTSVLVTEHPTDEKLHFEECLSRMHEYWIEEAMIPCEIIIFSEHNK